MKWITRGMIAAAVVIAGIALFAALGHQGNHATLAQLDCDDPFDGQRVAFNPDYWELTDFCQHSVSYAEIRSGGPPPNGIPPIYEPAFEPVDAAREWLVDRSPVIALAVGGEAKAYPLAILMWHEIANDTIGGVPVAVTFCPLCNASIVFDRRVGDDVLAFGTTGNLRGSDLVMWDDKTESWWQQFTGEAIVGSYTGMVLDMLPSQVVGFGDFATQYPDGQVLAIPPDFARSYGSNPYAFYDTQGTPLLSVAELDAIDDRLPLTSRVLGALVRGDAVAYPFDALVREGAINDTVGRLPVVALWQPGVASALDHPQIDQARDVGTAALFRRELDGRVLAFYAEAGGTIRDEETDSAWNAFGTAVSGELVGSQLQQVVASGHFWFAWSKFQPETRVYGLDE